MKKEPGPWGEGGAAVEGLSGEPRIITDGAPRAILVTLDGGLDAAGAPVVQEWRGTLQEQRPLPLAREQWVAVGGLWVDCRICARCQRPFAAGSNEPYTFCRACEPNEARLELSPDGLAAWTVVRAAHQHFHYTKSLAGEGAGGTGTMQEHSNVQQRLASLAAADAWWVYADPLFNELDRFFPEGAAA